MPFSIEHCHAFQLNGNGGGKSIDFNGCSARLCLRIREILRINAIERTKISAHVHQKNGDVHEIFPLASVGFEDGFDIAEYAVRLRGEIKGFEIAIVVQFETRDTAIICVAARKARPYSAQKQKITH